MKLIRNAKISPILAWTRIIILSFEDTFFICNFTTIIFFKRHPSNSIHGK